MIQAQYSLEKANKNMLLIKTNADQEIHSAPSCKVLDFVLLNVAYFKSFIINVTHSITLVCIYSKLLIFL